MAYTKQTWTDRQGTKLNKFTKANETLTTVELTNAPGSITQAGTPFSKTRMDYMEEGIRTGHVIGTPLSDLNRVFHLTGDGIPTFPDNVAGATNYWKNFISVPSGLTAQLSPTSSFSNGVWNISGSGTGSGYYTSSVPSAGVLIRIRIRVITGSVSVGIYSYSQITITNTNWLDYDFIGNGINALLFWTTGGAAEFEISDIYIGSGLYDTPVYDKACCNRATNYGVLPVKGPRGQALSFNGGQSLECDNPVIGTTGTIAFKLKDVTDGIICWNESYNSNGISIFYATGKLLVRFSYSGGASQLEANVSSTGSFVLTFVNGDIKLYRDTMIIATSTFANITAGSNNLKIGREVSGSYLTGVIYDLRYDSYIWTQDDAIRYHNGDDAVDSQQKSVTPVPHSIVTRGANGEINASNMFAYDLVIDSDAKLAAWAASGTWEKVLVKKGTWTLASGGVDLTARGTKLVIGEPGSKLVFSSAVNGLYYTSTPTTKDYRMDGVTVETTGTGTAVGFNNCTNITNCTGTGTGTGTGYGGVGFNNCTNITNCTGTGTCTTTVNGAGFSGCTNMTNCTGTGDGGNGYGFSGCTNMTNCTGTGTGTGTGRGFYICKKCQQNKAAGSTAKYYESYADAGTAYPCADTPNGGFNS